MAVQRGSWGIEGDLKETGRESSAQGAKGKDRGRFRTGLPTAAPRTFGLIVFSIAGEQEMFRGKDGL